MVKGMDGRNKGAPLNRISEASGIITDPPTAHSLLPLHNAAAEEIETETDSSIESKEKFDENDEREGNIIYQAQEKGAEPILLEEKTIEKILGVKNEVDENGLDKTLYFIKWKTKSYLHVTWETAAALERMDVNAKGKIKRFRQNPLESNNVIVPADEADDSLYFNQEYLEVDRILSCDPPSASHKDATSEEELQAMLDLTSPEIGDVESEVFYFVKWRRQQYNECTWERSCDLKNKCPDVFAFWQRQKLPSHFKYGPQSVTVQDYVKLCESPMFGGPGRGLMLRAYQLEGVNWLMWNWFHKRSCILADEMGLGKTIQTACFLQQLRDNCKLQIRGPHLVIAPLSLIRQWESELTEWCPEMNCVVLHGNAEARDVLIHNEFYYQQPFSSEADIRDARKRNIYKFDVLLTTYEVVIRDLNIICGINWKVLVLDEGHRLKNPTSRAFQKLLSIDREFCLLLTGTPLQNKTEELWSLLHFCNRTKFSNLQEFSIKFGDLKGSADVANLHDVLKPYLLRRIKEDVEKSLPPKQETIIEVTLTTIQKKYYRAVYEKNAEFLYRGARASNGPCLMNVMMELRKCCNHPYLLNGVEERVLQEVNAAISDPTPESRVATMNKALVESSGKLVLLDKLLPRLQQEGHKVLIFSQMVRALNIIEDFINLRGYTYERLDGSTRIQDRLTAIDRFGKSSLNTFIMLLSTKAGGLGLNLTAADTVIIYDSDWNPQNDLQAQARAHRIGQTKPVVVYRLLTKGTYETQMFHRASLKLGLDRAVLAHTRREAQEGSSTMSESLQVAEIDELLKKGAYDVFREDDTEIKEFMSADVDAILARSSTTVQYDKDAATSLSGTLGKFSKASFVSADDTEDVDINDPEFWWKTMRIENKSAADSHMADAAEYNQVVLGADGELKMVRSSLRKRKQTEGFRDSQASLPDFSKSQKRPHDDDIDVVEGELNGYQYDSLSDDDKELKRERQKIKIRKVALANQNAGEKKRKATAMITTLESKFPGMNSLAYHYLPLAGQNLHQQQRTQNLKPGQFLHIKRPRNEDFVDNMSFKPALSDVMAQHLSRGWANNSQWSPAARDRCVDLLLRFGFGRWSAIAKRMPWQGRTDVGNHSIPDVESFCRNIVMQCGLSALSNNEIGNVLNQTEFIRHAVAAAMRVQESIEKNEQHFEIPPVLLQDSFQKKLSSGRAIKALHRMDILNRIFAIVSNAVASVRSTYPGKYLPSDLPTSDVDMATALIPSNLLCKHMVLSGGRPPWLHVCDWWDDTCDMNLIIGTFKHGFSAYDDIGSDPQLCYLSKIRAAHLMYSSVASGEMPSVGPFAEPAVSIIRLDETKRCRLVIPPNRRTEYIGVCSHPGSASWIAFLVRDNLNRENSTEILGYFVEEEKAAKAYDARIRQLFASSPHSSYETNFDENGQRTEFKCSWPLQRPTLPWFHSSVFHGVRSAGNKWQAKIGFEGVLRHVGTFATDIEAAVVHDRFALLHAQHTAVKINFRTARDVVSELQKYAARGDIRMDFFDVPKTEEPELPIPPGPSELLVPVPVLTAPDASNIPCELNNILTSYNESYELAVAPSASGQHAIDIEGNFAGIYGEIAEPVPDQHCEIEQIELKSVPSVSRGLTAETTQVVTIPSAALDATLAGEAISRDQVSLIPRKDAVSAEVVAVSEPADAQLPRGSMPDSRTLNRLLTYLLGIGENPRGDSTVKGAKKVSK